MKKIVFTLCMLTIGTTIFTMEKKNHTSYEKRLTTLEKTVKNKPKIIHRVFSFLGGLAALDIAVVGILYGLYRLEYYENPPEKNDMIALGLISAGATAIFSIYSIGSAIGEKINQKLFG